VEYNGKGIKGKKTNADLNIHECTKTFTGGGRRGSTNNFRKLTICSSDNNTEQINIFVIKGKSFVESVGKKSEGGRWDKTIDGCSN
jgi:hypothetical protein